MKQSRGFLFQLSKISKTMRSSILIKTGAYMYTYFKKISTTFEIQIANICMHKKKYKEKI